MTSPQVSVVIPTRDRSALLRRAVASVLGQTFRDLELIVVDDASADDAARQVAEIDSRVRYVRHDDPKGPCGARNTGIRQARGHYLAFLDDDDEWLPEKLERQVRVFDSAPPDVGIVYTGVQGRRSNGRTRIVHATAGGDIYERLFDGSKGLPVNTVSMLARKECFDDVGLFDEGLPYGEGWDIFVRFAKRWKFAPISDPLVVIHRAGVGISSDLKRVIAGRRRLLQKHRAEIEAHPRSDSAFHLVLGVLELRQGNAVQARRDLARAISARPFNGRALAYYVLSFQPRAAREGFVSVWRRARLLWRRR